MFPEGQNGYRLGYRIRYVGAVGSRLRLVECGPTSGPVIVLVHGWGASAYAYRHTMPALSAEGWSVAAVDLPGHGGSDKPDDAESYRLESLVTTLAGALDALERPEVVLVGHSMGAPVVGRLAAVRRDVRALVLMSPVGLGRIRDLHVGRMLTPAWAARLTPYLARRFAVSVALRFAYAGGTGLTPTAQDVGEYWAPAQSPGFAQALRHLVHEFSWELTDTSWLEQITVPTLVIAGANDRVVNPDSARAYARHIPSARLTIIPEAGHAIQEQRPAEVNAKLIAFLREAVHFP